MANQKHNITAPVRRVPINGVLGISGDIQFGEGELTFDVVQSTSVGLSGAMGMTGNIDYHLPFNVARVSGPQIVGALGITGNIQFVTGASGGTGFFTIPSLQDERDTYTLLGRTWDSSDEVMSFNVTPPPQLQTDNTFCAPHEDTEGDDLWRWIQQKARGYTGGHSQAVKVANWINAWRGYQTGLYLNPHLLPNTSQEYLQGDYDHLYAQGLVLDYMINGNTGSLAAAETIGDYAIDEWSVGHADTTPPDPATFPVWSRNFARFAIVWTYLAHATNATKWKFWRDAAYESLKQSPLSWFEAPALGMATGTGSFFVPRSALPPAGTPPNADFVENDQGNFDAGQRFLNTFYFGLLAEAMILGYRVTGNATMRSRLIKMARYVLYYGHIPSHTVPLVGNYFGINHSQEPFLSAGGRWKPQGIDSSGVNTQTGAFYDNSTSCGYECSVINCLVWGYKLTGEQPFLDMARLCLANHNRWNSEGGPGATHQPPNATLAQVNGFVDTKWKSGTGVEQYQANYNKGALQYLYQVFENGGLPTVEGAQWQPPYTLPNPGQAVMIGVIDSTTAPFPAGSFNSTAPTPLMSVSRWGEANFLGDGSGFFHPYYSEQGGTYIGAYIHAGTGGHGTAPNTGALIFDFKDALWKRLDNINGMPHRQTGPSGSTTGDFLASELSGSPDFHILPGPFTGTVTGNAPHIPATCHTYMHHCAVSPALSGAAKGWLLHTMRAAMTTAGNGTSFRAYRLNLDNGEWAKLSTNLISDVVAASGSMEVWESSSLFDPNTGRYYCFHSYTGTYNRLIYLDSVDWTWKVTPTFPNTMNDYCRVYFFDPARRWIIAQTVYQQAPVFPGHLVQFQRIDVTSDTTIANGWAALTLSSGAIGPEHQSLWEYYPPDGCFYMCNGGGVITVEDGNDVKYHINVNGQRLERLRPPSSGNPLTGWVLDSVPITGATIPWRDTAVANGEYTHYRRFFYVPAIQCFGWVSSRTGQPSSATTTHDGRVCLIKPPPL